MDEKELDDNRIILKKKGYALFKFDDMPLHSYPYDAPWISDKEFSKVYNTIRRNTLIDRTRAYSLYLLTQQIKNVEGDVLEVGVWRGGTAGIFTSQLQDKTVYLADTFEGVVKSSEWEHYKDRAHDDTSENLVVNFLKHDIGVSNFEVLKGVFPEDTGSSIEGKPLSLVYLDVDVYLSTKDAFNYIWPQVTVGGVVAFDDYGMFSACQGISKFLHEIKDDRDKMFIPNLNGQAYIIKK